MTGKYNGGLTREQFLFHEMRTVARLMEEGLCDEEIILRVEKDNLFQYPTERMLKSIAQACLKRLHALDDTNLVYVIANGSSTDAKQICLYAMMAQNMLVYDFMVTVIGEKFASKDYSYGKIDMGSFFIRLQEQDDGVAGWSEATIKKIKQVLNRILVENEYLDDLKSDRLNTVWPCSALATALKAKSDMRALSAFNYFE